MTSAAIHILALTGLSAALANCRDEASKLSVFWVPARDSSPLQTDSLSYALVRGESEYRAYVRATYRNATAAPVYFKRCTHRDTLPMFDVRRTGADSTRGFFIDWAWACVGGVPTGVLAPGQAVTIQVPFGTHDQPHMQPRLRPEQLVGIFRVRLMLCGSPNEESDDCELLPAAQRQSNAFIVHY